ncbi:MAG: UDP-N-acetylmuramate dehydrogenase [Coriobacteriia bacterium]|nr:UDP-N-acetylmuramate dehydrogenase [Coriobacteriia bacterium]
MSLETLERKLRDNLSGEVLRREPMARHTTYRIGGPAEFFITCDTVADLAETVRLCDDEGLERITVGKGSNLLVADAGYPGAVITLGKEFKAHRIRGDEVETGAACILAYVVRDAYSRGLGGMEFAVGIPGTVGGAISMNAGSGDVWIGSVVSSVTVYLPGEGLTRLRADEIEWAYRSSGLPEGATVVETVLRLVDANRDAIRSAMDASLEKRKKSQPLGVPSAGSVFRNPPGDSAGRLIESAGLKGTRLGGARISEVHANFIVNDGTARAADVLGLVRKAQMTVRDTHGIELTPEIRFLGTFEDA